MDRIVIYRDEVGELRWRYVRHGNNETMATSGEGYKEVADLEAALLRILAPHTVGRDGSDRLTHLLRDGHSSLRVWWQL